MPEALAEGRYDLSSFSRIFSNRIYLELLEDAVEEMSEDLALPIAIVLIVGFLGNISLEFSHQCDIVFEYFFHIIFSSHFMHGNCHLVLRHPRFHCHRCYSPVSTIFCETYAINRRWRENIWTNRKTLNHTEATAQQNQLVKLSDPTTSHSIFQSFKYDS